MLPHLSELPKWQGAARVSIDIETRDDQLTELGPGVRRGGYITGVSFAVDRWGTGSPACPAFYLPVRHQGGGNYVDPRQVFDYLRDQARTFRGELAGANLGYDLDYLLEEGVEFQPARFCDVQLSGALLLQPELEWAFDEDTGEKYLAEKIIPMNLDALARREGLPGKDEAKLEAWAAERGLDPKKDMWRAHSGIITPYACQDARLPLQVLQKHLYAIGEQGLGQVWDLESRLLPVLVRMRRRGVRVNLERVGRIEEEARKRERAAAETVASRSGIPFDPEDINKAQVLEKHLAADGIKCPRTPTGLPSVKAKWLASLRTPTAQAIQACRKWNKVRTTFCESIRAHQVRGRIHCTFNQLRQERDDGSQVGVGFGRLSSTDPNLQQQPARDPEIGPLWRAIYEPDDGGQWACADFSSQEPRWITHYAEVLANEPESGWDAASREAGRKAAHECRTNPAWDNHSMMAGFIFGDKYSHQAYVDGDKKAKGMRGDAKIIFLGKCYGMGGGKLCRELGLPTVWVVRDPNAERWTTYRTDSPEGAALMKQGQRPFEAAGEEGERILKLFDRGVPYIRALMKSTSSVAEKRGWIRTAMGRRCRFPLNLGNVGDREDKRYAWGHKALNRLIQGTSADQTKLAMVLADEAGIPLQLQVHDELDLTVPDRGMADRLVRIMIDAMPCNVPTKVDVEMGPNWGEIHA
jgi:DNA polymerase I-like protein with 3'-5' exonuclease and polymerase domains